jgi:hypothetical protein
VIQNGFPDEALDIGGEKARLEKQGGESGEEFGKAVGRQVALDFSLMDGPQVGESDRMVRMLLEQSGHERRGVEAGFHGSESANLAAALFALGVDEGADIPHGRRDFAGTDEDPVFLGDGGRRLHGAKADAIGFKRDFQRVAGFESKTIPQAPRDHQSAHLIKRVFDGKQLGIWPFECQDVDCACF